MKVTDWAAIIALIISTAGFVLQLIRWFDEGPKLRLSVMADAIFVTNDDKRDKLVLTVINRGSAPTLITHMIAFTFDARWRKLLNKPSTTGIVNSTIQRIPSEIGVNQTFLGSMAYDDNLKKARTEGRLYVGVIASHSNKNFLIHVPPEKPEKKLNKVGA
ncbi:hypothetical protein Arad_4248 [Rhizobium rhizogenes K84]|uniref:Uncharacterized protein n=2 Tax=Rhizobium rhizogenes TaxID=359 RepID=B9JBU6_RHIR8|nr:hypothetical protein Arad_4248 [Rhizobium rhizogenes K84]